MKNIAIVALVLIGLAFYLFNKDPFPTSIYFSGEEYKLGEVSGKKDHMKIYQYSRSGTVSGMSDYVQIFLIVKSPETDEYVETIRKFVKDKYKLKPLISLSGEFGVFSPHNVEREYFSYFIERETPTAHWFMTFIIQSNFSENAISSNTAKGNAGKYISSLDAVFNDVSF